MPQFHLDNFLPQLVWLTVFFAILYFGIVRVTLPKVARIVEGRQAQVTGDLTTAEQSKREADALAADYAAGIDSAHKTARAAIGTAKARAAARIEAALAAGNATIADNSAAADAVLAAARGRAMAEIEAVAADAGADIVERLTGKRPDSGVVSDAARAALVV